MVIELIKYILPGFIQYHPILGRNFLSLGLARLRAVLALAEVKPRLMCAGHLDSHLVLGLWPVWLEFTTSMCALQFRLYYLSYVSVQVTKVIVEVNACSSYQSTYLISKYSCAQDCSSQAAAGSSIRGYQAGFAIYGVAHCRDTGVFTPHSLNWGL